MVAFAIKPGRYVDSGAHFSAGGEHRLLLWREWDHEGGVRMQGGVLWVCLNPSDAGAHRDDLTVAKAVGFSKQAFAAKRIELVNLFTYISTDPRGLGAVDRGRRVHHALDALEMAVKRLTPSDHIVAAWGDIARSDGPSLRHAETVLRILCGRDMVWCLGTTKSGQPRRPSRLGYDTPMEPYRMKGQPTQ